MVVTATRLAPSINEPAYATTTLSRADLERAAGDRIDDILRAVPGFGLFRRQSSRAAHPTTQGVSLRGIGPSGAGRTLVLLDGIPQNDPFGGWVDWSRIPSAALESAAITRGGGAGSWGNTALGGVVRLQSRDEQGQGGFIDADAGPHDTYDGTLGVHGAHGRVAWHGIAHGHRTDGSYLIRADQRGPVDIRAEDRGAVAEFGARIAVTDDTVVRVVGRASESRFTNGIAIAGSKTRITDGAVSLVHDGGDGQGWEINAYARDQDFSAVFAAVGAGRATATASLDQFAVLAKALGANAVVRRKLGDAVRLDAGADVRHAEGATNENFQNLGAGFTRLRRAGGEQLLAGAFAELNWTLDDAWLFTVGGRADAWRQTDGFRRESILATGQVARDERFADRDATVGSLRAAARYAVNDALAVRAAAYNAFRLPTLNELYRPFRVGNDITEANPALGVERLEGADLGLEWSMAGWAASVSVFHATLKDAVTNVTVQTTPGFNAPLNTTVPAGGVLRQRRNIDRIETSGFETRLQTTLSANLEVTVSYLLSSPNVTRSPQQPALEGLRVAQVPRHQGTVQLTWTPAERLSLSGQVRGASRQYDDDQNTRVLRGYVVADATASYELGNQTRVVLSVENAFDRTIESGRSADGLVSVGTPRTVHLGLRAGF